MQMIIRLSASVPPVVIHAAGNTTLLSDAIRLGRGGRRRRQVA
jgi:hypothetical protein